MNNLITAFLLTILAAAPALAGGPELPAIFTKIKPKVGSWAQYSFETKKGDKTKAKGLFRIAVVGKKGDSLWIEQKMTPEIPKPRKDEVGGIMKFLSGKDGIEKAFVKTEDGVMDMTAMMSRGSRKKQEAIDKAKMTEAGAEKIEVPAGKFKATRFTFEDGKNTGDAWIKPGVGPYGMIKQIHREGKLISTIELLSSGGDAKSEVDEKSAQSAFGAMMGGEPEAATKAKSGKAKAAKKGGWGGMLKSAIKSEAGLGDD